MKVESIRAVKANLNRIVGGLPKGGSVVITKNGRACAVLMPVTDDTDLEVVALSQNKAFWGMFDRAVSEAEDSGWIPLEAVAKSKPKRVSRPRRPAKPQRRKFATRGSSKR